MSSLFKTPDAPNQAKLKVARLEIEAVLKKHDLGGLVVLHTPGMSEFFYEVNPSWSCLTIDEAVGHVRVLSKLENFGGDKRRQGESQAATAELAFALAEQCTEAARMFSQVSVFVTKVLRATHQAARHVADPAEGKLQ
jgi:hypothetical protein